MRSPSTPSEGQILSGPLFNEPMRVETIAQTGPGSWTLGLVGTRSERFRKVSIRTAELAGLTVLDSGFRYDGDGALLRLGLQADALGIASEFDPYFGLSVSRVDPLPHQLEAVYDHLLRLPRVRFLLADDAGAGKTIMAGLLIRELQLRGLAERILIVAQKHTLEWVTPGHPLFEALRRDAHDHALEPLTRGATYYSLAHDAPARIDFYRARVVDGLGDVVHERIFAVQMAGDGQPRRCEPGVVGDLTPASVPDAPPEITQRAQPMAWLQEHVLTPFLNETRRDRLAKADRVAAHVELSLTELLQRADDEIGRVTADVESGGHGAEGRLAMAEARHGDLLARRERRRKELQQQRALSLQGVERITSVLVLPHPDRTAAEVKRHQPDPRTEATAMRVVIDHERQRGRRVDDVSADNVGYDVTSLDPVTGDIRLIEVKGLAAATGTVLLTPNERRVAEDRPDCYWLYVVTDCGRTPVLQEPIANAARFPWQEVTKVQHYYLSVDAMKMQDAHQ